MYLRLSDLNLFVLTMIVSCFFLFMELISQVSYLPLCSLLLVMLFIVFYRFGDQFGVASPFLVFSLMYMGYSIGGLYYSQSDGYFGKFLGFMNYSKEYVESMLLVAALFSSVCYVFFAVGYCFFSSKKAGFEYQLKSSFDAFLLAVYKPLAIVLLIVGFFYWIWVCQILAGGVIDAFILFQVFPHLVAEHQVSTLPYLFYYAGVYLLLIGLLLEKSKIGFWFWIASIVGFLISISTARISLSVTYLFAQLYLIYLVDKNKRVVIVRFILLIVFLAFVVFFLRELSNYNYIGRAMILNVSSIFESIVGGGNVTDLQQIVIVLSTFEVADALLGATYFDWIINTFGVFFGLDPSSVGLSIADRYVPESSGAPTPGAIGEAYVNFGFGAPIFMFFVGLFFAIVKNLASKSHNIFVHFSYSCFVVNFVFLFPKVDSTMMANFFWATAPVLAIVCSLFLFHKSINNLCGKLQAS